MKVGLPWRCIRRDAIRLAPQCFRPRRRRRGQILEDKFGHALGESHTHKLCPERITNDFVAWEIDQGLYQCLDQYRCVLLSQLIHTNMFLHEQGEFSGQGGLPIRQERQQFGHGSTERVREIHTLDRLEQVW